VWVLEAGGDLDLPKKALRTERGGELMAQQLDGNESAVLEVPSKVDGGHATATQLSLYSVAIDEGGLK
jgi:hypothetical protein